MTLLRNVVPVSVRAILTYGAMNSDILMKIVSTGNLFHREIAKGWYRYHFSV